MQGSIIEYLLIVILGRIHKMQSRTGAATLEEIDYAYGKCLGFTVGEANSTVDHDTTQTR